MASSEHDQLPNMPESHSASSTTNTPIEPRDVLQDVMQVVEKSLEGIEDQIPVEGRLTRTVAIHVTWELQQCIRDEMKGDTDLKNYAVITARSTTTAWVTNVIQYVEGTWGRTGVALLEDFMILIAGGKTTSEFSIEQTS